MTLPLAATVSFSFSNYTVLENIKQLSVAIERSGNTEIEAIVLVATEDFHGTAYRKHCITNVLHTVIICFLNDSC